MALVRTLNIAQQSSPAFEILSNDSWTDGNFHAGFRGNRTFYLRFDQVTGAEVVQFDAICADNNMRILRV